MIIDSTLFFFKRKPWESYWKNIKVKFKLGENVLIMLGIIGKVGLGKGFVRRRHLNRCLNKFITTSTNDGQQKVYYPWISTTFEPDPFFATKFKDFNFYLYRKMMFGGDDSFINQDDVLLGAEAAFKAVTSTVFPVSSQIFENESDNGTSTTDLSEFCEFKLAEFYNAANNPLWPRKACYTLHEITSARIVEREAVIGAHRRNVDQFGSVLDGGSVVLIFKAEEFSFSKDALAELYMSGHLTLRYTIEFTCNETFFVKDKHTDKVLQGSDKPTVTTHMMTIENYMPFEPTGLKSPLFQLVPDRQNDWMVVDIDNWLHGNRFWERLRCGIGGDPEMQ